MTPSEHLISYQLGLSWSEAATLLLRERHAGRGLSDAEREVVLEAAEACAVARLELSFTPLRPVGRALVRSAAALYPLPALLEALGLAERTLKTLAAGGPVELGRLAWLAEFLSEGCHMLWRDVATRSYPQAVSKGA